MRDGALWVMLLIGAASLGSGWNKGWDALQAEVALWVGVEPGGPHNADGATSP